MHSTKTQLFIDKAVCVHGTLYDYSKSVYMSAKQKITIICNKHGEFLQTPSSHTSGHGCSKCTNMYTPTTDEWIAKALTKHGPTYDYSKTKYINNRIKVIIVCKIHGEFEQNPDSHIRGTKCPKCSKRHKYTTKEWIDEAIKVHGNEYDYSKSKYIKSSAKVIIICHKHGEFKQSPSSHLSGRKCKKCSNDISASRRKKSTSQFISDAVKTHGDIYDYSKVDYVSTRTKIIIICKTHGEFSQSPSHHINGSGCTKCVGLHKYTTKEWIDRAREVHGNTYDYSKVKYINSTTKIIIVCRTHGEFTQAPDGHINGKYGCSKCSQKYNYNTKEWIKCVKKVHGDLYDYSKTQYINCSSKIIIVCKLHGDFEQVPDKHLNCGHGCPMCLLCPSCLLWRTRGKLCEYCKPKNKLYLKTKELDVVKYLRQQLPEHDFFHNKSVGSECTKNDRPNTNGHLYPDIRFDCIHYHLIVEIDEFRHRGSDYACDKRRMYDIIAKLGMPCIFVRYNPDNKNSDKNVLLDIVKKYLDLSIDSSIVWDNNGFKVEYLFY